MLIVFDIDGTLAATPPVVGNDFAGWEREIHTLLHPPVAGAIEGVAELLATGHQVALLSARSARLHAATLHWLREWMPALRGVHISLRPTEDLRPSALTKWDRLERMRGDHPIVLVDDDPVMAVACHRAGDTFMHAPTCWELAVRQVAARITVPCP